MGIIKERGAIGSSFLPSQTFPSLQIDPSSCLFPRSSQGEEQQDGTIFSERFSHLVLFKGTIRKTGSLFPFVTGFLKGREIFLLFPQKQEIGAIVVLSKEKLPLTISCFQRLFEGKIGTTGKRAVCQLLRKLGSLRLELRLKSQGYKLNPLSSLLGA